MVHSPSPHQEYLEAIQAAPDTNGPRQVYAQWLSSIGDLRGELMRLQCPKYLSPHERALHDIEHEERIRELATFERDRLRLLLDLSVARPVFERGFLIEADIPMDEFVTKAHQIFREAPLLSHVHFGMAVKPKDCAALAQCPHLSHLRGISFSTCWKQFSGKEGDACLQILLNSPHLHNLEELCVWRSELTDEGVLALCLSPIAKTLRTLRLPSNPIENAGVMALGEHVFPALETLDINRCDLTPHALHIIASSVWKDHLRRLDLSGNTLDDKILDVFVQRSFPLLKYVRIQDGEYSAEALKKFLSSSFAQQLKEFDLSHSDLGKGCIEAFAAAPPLQLERLDLTQTDLNVKDVYRLHLSGKFKDCIVDVSGNYLKETVTLPPGFIAHGNDGIPAQVYASEVFLGRPNVW